MLQIFREIVRVEVAGGYCKVKESSTYHEDSLFAAITHQIHECELNSDNHKSQIDKARSGVAKYIQDNKEEYEDALGVYCNNQSLTYDSNFLTTEDKVNKYIDNLKNKDEPGGMEIMTALACYLDINIVVYKEKGMTVLCNIMGSKEIKIIQRVPFYENVSAYYESVISFHRNSM